MDNLELKYRCDFLLLRKATRGVYLARKRLKKTVRRKSKVGGSRY